MDFDPRDWGYGHFQYEGYKATVDEARARWDGRLEVLAGVEIDYQGVYEDDIARFLADKVFDFVLGSVHACREGWFDPEFLASHEERYAYGLYFREMDQLVRCRLFDCIGHLDYVKRFGVEAYGAFDFPRWVPVLEKVLAAAIQHGLGMEINTSGLRQAPGETFPGLPALELYHRLGGRVLTVGSDAHRPEDVGVHVPLALDLAREAGFDSITFFQYRQPHYLPLGGLK